MPNHFHEILIIDSDNWKKRNGQARSVHEENENQYSLLINEDSIKSLSQLVGAFKALWSRGINKLDKLRFNHLIFKWHKSFHDRIIRDERELNNVRNYIKNNPLKWHYDIENSKEKINDTRNNAYYEKIINPQITYRTERAWPFPPRIAHNKIIINREKKAKGLLQKTLIPEEVSI